MSDGQDMPGMDMGGQPDALVPGTHGTEGGSTASHTRSGVLGGFAVVNGGVLVAALVLRRRRGRSRTRSAFGEISPS
jgi:hypothetical protein